MLSNWDVSLEVSLRGRNVRLINDLGAEWLLDLWEAFGKEGIEVPWRCGIQCCSPPIWQCVTAQECSRLSRRARHAAKDLGVLPKRSAIAVMLSG